MLTNELKAQRYKFKLSFFIFELLPFNSQFLSGGGERDRTDDLLRARQALSQLSYTPTKLHICNIPKPEFDMVGLDGVEPSTSRLSGVRSNQTELQALSIAECELQKGENPKSAIRLSLLSA